MIARDAIPTSHVTPLPRIEIGASEVVIHRTETAVMAMTATQWADRLAVTRENARIWKLVVEASGGTAV